MEPKSNIPNPLIVIIAIVILAAGLSCIGLSGGITPTVPADQNAPPAPPAASKAPDTGQPAATNTPAVQRATQPPIPEGWKLSKDASGACQVAAPPDWQLGKDFFLKAEKIDPGLFAGKPGQFPPIGLDLWGVDEGTQLPEGKLYQARTSLVVGEHVCSVWRIKAAADFSDAEKSELEKVGKTLQGVN